MGIACPVSSLMNAPLSVLKACASYSTQPALLINRSSFAKGQFSQCSLRGVLIGKLPCVDHKERPIGHVEPTLTTVVDPALSLLYVSEVMFHPVPNCVGFFDD